VKRVLEHAHVYIPLAGIVDRAGEIAKLQKELAGVDKEASALAVKLANERFVEHSAGGGGRGGARASGAARGASPEAAGHAGGVGRVTPAPLDPGLYREVVRRALAEDLGWGDGTSALVVPEGARATGVFVARPRPLSPASMSRSRRSPVDPAVEVDIYRRDGDLCRAERADCRRHRAGRADADGGTTALNFLRHLSGVASSRDGASRPGGGDAAHRRHPGRRCRCCGPCRNTPCAPGGGIKHPPVP